MARLLAIIEKSLGASWLDISEWLRNENDLDVIEARLVAGNLAGVIAEIEAAAKRFAASVDDAFDLAGKREAAWLDKQLPKKLITFDRSNVRAIRIAEQNKLELVQGIVEDQRTVIRNVLVEGAQGTNPRVLARRLRDSIGLTPKQEAHVTSYRRALESQDYSNALGRELRDARSDRSLRAAMENDTALSQVQIDRMVERYRKNYVAFRAETIARTEGLPVLHQATEEAVRQAIDLGQVTPDRLEKGWNAGPVTKFSREDHLAMEDRPPIPFLDDFVLPDGTHMAHPGDRRGGAKHNARCRCNRSVRMKSAVAAPVAAAA